MKPTKNISAYMDENQKKLSDRFGATNWLGNPKHVEQVLMMNT